MSNENEQSVPTSSNLYCIYQALESRRSSYELQIWQTAAISMAAQSFMMTLELGANSKSTVRIAVAILSLAISLVTMQLMSKNRWAEMLDSELLTNLEKRFGLSEVMEVLPHDKLVERIPKSASRETQWRLRKTWIRGISAYRLWQIGMSLFGMTSVAVIVLVISGSSTRFFELQ